MTDNVVYKKLLPDELDFGYTKGRQPIDDPDRTLEKRTKERDDPLEVLIEEAVAMRNAKILIMDLVKTNDQGFDEIEDTVHPLWPVVWWDECCVQFHPNDLGIGWDTDFGRQKLEMLYSFNSIDSSYRYFVGHKESCIDMFVDEEKCRIGTMHFGKIPQKVLKLLSPHQIGSQVRDDESEVVASGKSSAIASTEFSGSHIGGDTDSIKRLEESVQRRAMSLIASIESPIPSNRYEWKTDSGGIIKWRRPTNIFFIQREDF